MSADEQVLAWHASRVLDRVWELIVAVHSSQAADVVTAVQRVCEVPAPPGVDPVVAMATVMAAGLPVDRAELEQRLGWVRGLEARPNRVVDLDASHECDVHLLVTGRPVAAQVRKSARVEAVGVLTERGMTANEIGDRIGADTLCAACPPGDRRWRMARVLIDDMTEELIRGESEGGTHTLALDEEAVELDLTTLSKEKLRELLAPYFAAGREVAARGRQRGPKQAPSTASAAPAAEPASRSDDSDRASDAQVREWARRNSVEVNDIGRVKASVREMYERAQAAPKPAPRPAPPASNGHAPLAPPRPRPEQLEMAEQMLAQGTTEHTVAGRTGMTVPQVRELQAKLADRAGASS